MTLTTHGYAVPPQGLKMLHHPSDDGKPMPFPSRADGMSMNVVRPKDVPRGKIACEKDYQQALLASDIRGAVPSFMTQSLHVEGPPHKDFIKGSVARSSYPSIEKQQDLSLTTHDVDGAQPKAKVFKTTRQTNPLTPRYTLQSAPMDVPPPNSTRTHELLQRDTMSFKGTSSSRIPMRDYTHNPAEGHDVEMSQPNIRNRVNVTTPRETLRTLERSGERILSGKYVSTGNSSMAPDYKVHTRTTHPFYRETEGNPLAPSQVGLVSGSTPRVLHRDNGEPQASLIRADIPGAVPQRYKGHVPINIYDTHTVTPFSPYTGLVCSDIEGAQTGTRKSGTT